MDIFKIFNERKVDYDKIKQSLFTDIVDEREVDISVIIPVRGRKYFTQSLIDHLKNAINECKDKKIAITLVEHCDIKDHYDICKGQINYIWSHGENKVFNKCLSFDIGFLFSNKAKYYMFHDIDIMMKKNFFVQLFQNLDRVKTGALQTFSRMRVMYCDDVTTRAVLDKRLTADTIRQFTEGTPGAPGGSLLVPRDQFIRAGGYDPEYFWGYSIEDQFFYDKMKITGGINSCDIPAIDVFHMNHPTNYENEFIDQQEIYRIFKYATLDNKLELINLKKIHFEQYIK